MKESGRKNSGIALGNEILSVKQLLRLGNLSQRKNEIYNLTVFEYKSEALSFAINSPSSRWQGKLGQTSPTFHRNQTVETERTRIRKSISLPPLCLTKNSMHYLGRTEPSRATPGRIIRTRIRGGKRKEREKAERGIQINSCKNLKKERRSL